MCCYAFAHWPYNWSTPSCYYCWVVTMPPPMVGTIDTTLVCSICIMSILFSFVRCAHCTMLLRPQLLNNFITKALEYKIILKIICMHCYAFLSDESLFTWLYFDVIATTKQGFKPHYMIQLYWQSYWYTHTDTLNTLHRLNVISYDCLRQRWGWTYIASYIWSWNASAKQTVWYGKYITNHVHDWYTI